MGGISSTARCDTRTAGTGESFPPPVPASSAATTTEPKQTTDKSLPKVPPHPVHDIPTKPCGRQSDTEAAMAQRCTKCPDGLECAPLGGWDAGDPVGIGSMGHCGGGVMDPRLDSVDDDLVSFRAPVVDDDEHQPQPAHENEEATEAGYRFVAPGELPWPTRRPRSKGRRGSWGDPGAEPTGGDSAPGGFGAERRTPLRPAHAWLVVATVLCLLAAAVVAGRMTAGTSGTDAPGPRSRDGAVPTGFAHSSEGAAAAAADYAALVATPALADPSSMGATLAAVAAPGADFDDAAAAAVDGLGARLGETGVAFDDKVVFRTFPLTVDVRRYSETLADVEVWAASVLAVEGTRPAAAAFVTYRFSLSWSAGDWRVEDLTVRATPQDPAVPGELVDFAALQYVPVQYGGSAP